MKKVVIFDMGGVFLHFDFLFREKVDERMVALLRDLKEQGHTVLLLSNIFVRNSRYYKNKFPFLELFDALYFSSDIKLNKPDPRAYEYVLKTSGVDASNCIFFDDREDNIAGARSVGIEAYVFAGAEDTRQKILAA